MMDLGCECEKTRHHFDVGVASGLLVVDVLPRQGGGGQGPVGAARHIHLGRLLRRRPRGQSRHLVHRTRGRRVRSDSHARPHQQLRHAAWRRDGDARRRGWHTRAPRARSAPPGRLRRDVRRALTARQRLSPPPISQPFSRLYRAAVPCHTPSLSRARRNQSFCSAAAQGDRLLVAGSVLRYGRTLGFTEVSIRRREEDGTAGRLVAVGRHTKFFPP